MLNFSVSDGHKFSVFIFSSWQNKGILNETVIAYKLDSTTGLIPHSLNYKTVEIVSFNFLENYSKVHYRTQQNTRRKGLTKKGKRGVNIQGELVLILLRIQNSHRLVIVLSLRGLSCVLIPPASIIWSEVLANPFTNVFFSPQRWLHLFQQP